MQKYIENKGRGFGTIFAVNMDSKKNLHGHHYIYYFSIMKGVLWNG